MTKIAIIPARGGSKRIPRKNIKEFLGKPIIAYSIEAALRSNLFDEVMVSTDDEEIAEISYAFGAKVPFMRSSKTSDDFATTADVLKEVITCYGEAEINYTYACCIYPTAPLISIQRLKEGFDVLLNSNYDSVFPVTRFSYPIWRSLRLENGKAFMNWPEYLNSRSQDLPIAYHDAGQFYWFNVKSFLVQLALFTTNSGVIELDDSEIQDIDNIGDWMLAELKYKLLTSSDRGYSPYNSKTKR